MGFPLLRFKPILPDKLVTNYQFIAVFDQDQQSNLILLLFFINLFKKSLYYLFFPLKVFCNTIVHYEKYIIFTIMFVIFHISKDLSADLE